MYITINNVRYPCMGYAPREGLSVSFTGIAGVSLPVTGEIGLYREDGFQLAAQYTGDYERQTYADGILTLTNEPEPIPQPELEPQEEPLTITDLAEAVLDLQVEVTSLKMGVN